MMILCRLFFFLSPSLECNAILLFLNVPFLFIRSIHCGLCTRAHIQFLGNSSLSYSCSCCCRHCPIFSFPFKYLLVLFSTLLSEWANTDNRTQQQQQHKKNALHILKWNAQVQWRHVLSCINKMYLKDCFYCGYYFILIILFNVFFGLVTWTWWES